MPPSRSVISSLASCSKPFDTGLLISRWWDACCCCVNFGIGAGLGIVDLDVQSVDPTAEVAAQIAARSAIATIVITRIMLVSNGDASRDHSNQIAHSSATAATTTTMVTMAILPIHLIYGLAIPSPPGMPVRVQPRIQSMSA
jgi:hypothetical protein